MFLGPTLPGGTR